jgi:hypothetical protein
MGKKKNGWQLHPPPPLGSLFIIYISSVEQGMAICEMEEEEAESKKTL